MSECRIRSGVVGGSPSSGLSWTLFLRWALLSALMCWFGPFSPLCFCSEMVRSTACSRERGLTSIPSAENRCTLGLLHSLRIFSHCLFLLLERPQAPPATRDSRGEQSPQSPWEKRTERPQIMRHDTFQDPLGDEVWEEDPASGSPPRKRPRSLSRASSPSEDIDPITCVPRRRKGPRSSRTSSVGHPYWLSFPSLFLLPPPLLSFHRCLCTRVCAANQVHYPPCWLAVRVLLHVLS